MGPMRRTCGPPEIDVTSLLGSRGPSVGGEATLLVRVDRGHELRERASEIGPAAEHVGFDRVTLTYSDLERLVHQVLEHADDVVVVEPVVLRDAVVDALSSLSTGA